MTSLAEDSALADLECNDAHGLAFEGFRRETEQNQADGLKIHLELGHQGSSARQFVVNVQRV